MTMGPSLSSPAPARPDRPAIADVAVIGGGVIGLALALRLAREGGPDGLRVTLIADGAPRASSAAAGMLAGSFEVPPPADSEPGAHARLLFDFSRAALSAWQSFAETWCGVSADHPAGAIDYRRNGIIGLVEDAAACAAVKRDAHSFVQCGVPATFLDAPALRARVPALRATLEGGLFVADEGQVDPLRLLAVLARAVDAEPAITRHPARAEALEADGGAMRVTCDGPDGALQVRADRVVIATGAARGLMPGLPVVPVKGEALSLVPAPAFMPDHVIRGAGAYLCPKADGRLVIGASEWRGLDDLTPDGAAIDALRRAAEALIPGLGDAPEQGRWAGVRPGTPDDRPVIGPVSRFVAKGIRAGDAWEGRVFLGLGHYRNGILWAPLTAEILTRLILEQPLRDGDDACLAAFSPARFAPDQVFPR